MHKNLQQPLIVLFLAFSCIFLLSFNGSHPTGGGGRTGAPGDGLCLDCHTNVSSSIDGSVSISGIPALVEAGMTYNVSITSEYTSGTAIAAGFQVVALLDSDDSNAGTWSNPTGNSSINSGGGRTYFGHQPSTNFGAATSITWTADWTAPAVSSNDDITFYATTALVNDNNNNSGDKIKFSTLTTSIEATIDPLTCMIVLEQEPCLGEANGVATIVADGGDGNYTYAWPDGTSTATNSMLGEGSYFVTVTDGLGTSNNCEIIILDPSGLDLSLLTSDALCFGYNLGSAEAIVQNGNPPYIIQWSTGESGISINNLEPGTYGVTVTDESDCSIDASFTITGPDSDIEVNVVSAVDASCNGVSDGSITVLAIGGTPGYTYFWPASGTSGPTISGLDAGVYTVEVSDANDCLVLLDVEISTGTGITFDIESVTSAGCEGEDSGAVTIAAADGTPDYIYTWSNGGSGPTQENLAPGLYIFTITDAIGCTIVGEVDITAIDEEAPMLTETVFNVGLDADGMGSFSIDDIIAVATDNCEVESVEADIPALSCSSIGSTMIDVILTDVNMNSVTIPIVIATFDGIVPTTTCPDNVVSNTCGAVTYDMPTAMDNCEVVTFEMTEGLASGEVFPVGVTTVIYTATDGSGNTSSCSFTVEVIADLAMVTSSTNLNCFGDSDGSIAVTISGGTEPYIMTPDANDLDSLVAGDYVITVMDNNGCSVIETVTITQPDELVVNTETSDVTCFNYIDGSVTFDITGGTAPYMINFMNGLDYTMLESGDYIYSVVDSNGCETSGSVVVYQPDALIISGNTIVNASGAEVADGSIMIEVEGGVGAYTYSWTQDGAIISDNKNLEEVLPGTYVCVVTDENGCIYQSPEYIVDFNSSVKINDISANINVYPNPSNGHFSIDLGEDLNQIDRITLYNAQGIQIDRKNIDGSNNMVLGDNISSGVYLLKIEAGEQFGIKKLMIIK